MDKIARETGTIFAHLIPLVFGKRKENFDRVRVCVAVIMSFLNLSISLPLTAWKTGFGTP